MLQALLASVASIKAQNTAMNVIGNDLANVNTTAYKGTRVTFQEMIAQTLRGATAPSSSLGGTNPVQFGLGVAVAGTDTDNSQGSLNATNRPSDLAIQGNGYLMVSNGSTVAYTRDGALALDANGNLVQSATGERLLGYTADSYGNIDTTAPVSPQSAINIPLGSLNAVQVTKQVTWSGNLSGSAVPADSWTAEVQVYDALGGAHTVTMAFTNRQSPPTGTPPAGAQSSWDWTAYEGTGTGGPAIGSSAAAGNSSLYFDGNGAYINNMGTGFNTVTVPATSGTTAFPINLDFNQVSQLNASSSLAAKNQNGYPPGSLQGYSIGQDGIITGLFTNGLTRALGQVAMSIFPNADGLQSIGNNLWQATNNSGIAVTGAPSTGSRGSISSGFLEQSNIDIGSEFTNLIVTQRGFQANTKVVTTVDQMLQDLINMKQ